MRSIAHFCRALATSTPLTHDKTVNKAGRICARDNIDKRRIRIKCSCYRISSAMTPQAGNYCVEDVSGKVLTVVREKFVIGLFLNYFCSCKLSDKYCCGYVTPRHICSDTFAVENFPIAKPNVRFQTNGKLSFPIHCSSYNVPSTIFESSDGLKCAC